MKGVTRPVSPVRDDDEVLKCINVLRLTAANPFVKGLDG